MAKYRIYLETTASTAVEVEADSKEEAYEKSGEMDMPRICAQCSGWGNKQNLELGDIWEIPGGDVEQYVEEIGDK